MAQSTFTSDVTIYESGSGGDLAVQNNDLLLSEQIFQLPYLMMFGGNLAASTLGNEPPNQPRFDWWANSLIFPNNPVKQFNSLTEKALMANPLNSMGRLAILQAMNDDLSGLETIADITTNVVILGNDKVGLYVTMAQPDSLQNKTLQFIWDNAKQELIQYQII